MDRLVDRLFLRLLVIVGTLAGLSSCFSEEGYSPDDRQAAEALWITPSLILVPLGQQVDFFGRDGLPPYTYEVTFGTGSVDPNTGRYTAPMVAEKGVIEVTDSEGSRAIAVVSVVSPLQLQPDSMKITEGHSLDFTTVGGLAPFHYQITQGEELGSIHPETGLFTAIKAGSAVIEVSDSGGFRTQASVTIFPPPKLNPLDPVINIHGRIQFSTVGGTPPLSYSLTGTGASLDPVTGEFKAGELEASPTVRVTDALGYYSTSKVTIYKPDVLASGDSHNCYLRRGAGRVQCWGANSFGQLGVGHTGNIGDEAGEMGANLKYVNRSGTTFEHLASGSRHSCASTNNEKLKCWGDNSAFQLGTDHSSARDRIGDAPGENDTGIPEVSIGSPSAISELALGDSHSCLLGTYAGVESIKCWGSNTYGQLGQGLAPTAIIGDVPASEMGSNLVSINLGFTPKGIASGRNHLCAWSTAGAVKCWGRNNKGQLGIGSSTDAASPVSLNLNGAVVKSMALGDEHSCALLSDGKVKCWGDNSFGQLGLNSLSPATVGTTASHMGANLQSISFDELSVDEVFAGAFHTCVRTSDNQLRCFGKGLWGQLGYENSNDLGGGSSEVGDLLAAVKLGTGRISTTIGAGSEHTCSFLDDGRLKCWGKNDNGQLGLGDTTDRGDNVGEMGNALPFVGL